MPEKNIKYIKGNNENNVDIAFIRKELAQYLQLDHLNFLLGAGCSSHIEAGTELGIPGMRDLYNGFFEENPEFKVGSVKAKGHFDSNLEKMLETMGAIKVIDKLIEFDNDIDNKIKIIKKYIKDKIIDRVESPEIIGFYKEFYLKTLRKGKKAPVNIFTTNYDLFNEQALDRLGFPYNNGFIGTYRRRFNPISYKYAFVENMNLYKDVWQTVPNYYNLYKLHGSISWSKESDQVWETNYKFIKDEDTLMIYPTPLKDRSTLMTPYSDLFRCMENSLLQNNSILITMGYSFGDEHINRLILNALAIPSFRLVVFGNSTSINKLKELNDTRIVIINSEDKIHYFKNIVQFAMPELQEEFSEENDIHPVDDIIKRFEETSYEKSSIN